MKEGRGAYSEGSTRSVGTRECGAPSGGRSGSVGTRKAGLGERAAGGVGRDHLRMGQHLPGRIQGGYLEVAVVLGQVGKVGLGFKAGAGLLVDLAQLERIVPAKHLV